MEIRIQKLTLENFKCHGCLKLNLEGRSASVFGANGSGKSTLREAFQWLLYGGASAPVRTLNSRGEALSPYIVTVVEGQLTRDGVPITLRKCLREAQTVVRGRETPVFTGNQCEYFVDGVPCRKGKFDETVRGLIPENLFRMLTDPCWFGEGMKWQERRSVLMDMVGVESNKALIQGNERFEALLPFLENQTLGDYKAKLLREKQGYCHSRDQYHARWEECDHLLKTLSQPQDTPSEPFDPDKDDAMRRHLEGLISFQRLAGAVEHDTKMRCQIELRSIELEGQRSKACQELNRIEEQLSLLEAFTRYKAEKLGEGVNDLFPRATVRLRRNQMNGGYEERCDILSGGIPFPDLSSAGKVQVGLEIIDVLSRFYGVRLPLFLDNAESVSHPLGYEGQLIRLEVSEKDEKLRLELQ